MAWAVYAAVLVTIGLVRDNPSLRWMAMALLGVTVLKVFFLDLRAAEETRMNPAKLSAMPAHRPKREARS